MGDEGVERTLLTAVVTFVGFYLGGPGGAQGAISALQATVITTIVSKAASEFQKEPDPGVNTGKGRTQTVRQEAAPRQIIYGEARVGGTFTFIESTDNNRNLHVIITLAGHECNAIRDIYFDDEVAVDANGNISSQYQGKRETGDVSVDGANNRFVADQNAATPAGLATNRDAYFVGQIIRVSGFANSVNNGMHRITSVVRDEQNNEHRVTVETNLTDEGETSATFHGDFVFVDSKLGTANQSAVDNLVRLSNKWTTSHRQRECAHLYVVLRWNRDKWATGIPNISAVVQGKNDVYDPRDDTNKYTANPALCISDFLTWGRFGFNADYSTEVNESELIASANVCDESVNLSGGGSETRYTINGSLSAQTKIVSNLNAMMSAMAGEIIWSGGQWYIFAGYYRSPSVTFDEDDLRGPLSVSTGVSRQQLFNSIKGTYVSPDNSYIEAGFPAVTNSTYQTQDGEPIWENINLPFTDSPSMAQRIAKIQLEQVRQQITVKYPTTLKGLKVKAGDVVNITNSRMGWTNKPFEIVDWQLTVDSKEENPIFGVDLELRETASAVYDWNKGEETTVDPAPDTNLPDPFNVATPRNVSVASGTNQLYRKKDGTVVSRILVTWDAPNDVFVKEFEVQAKRSGDAEWLPVGKPEDDDRSVYVWDVEDDVDYDVRMRTINPFLVRSDWVTINNHTVVGKTEPPPDVTNLFAVQNGESVIIRWIPVNVTDLAGYELRYGPSDRATWNNSNKISEVERGTRVTEADIPPGDYTFSIKAIDTSGNYSVNSTTKNLVVGTNYVDLFRTTHETTWDDGRYIGFDLVGDALIPNNDTSAYYESSEVDVGFDATGLRVWANVDAATTPVTESEEYGSITGPITEMESYGLVSESVTETDDYGQLLTGLAISDPFVTYEIAYRDEGEEWGGGTVEIDNYGLVTGSVESSEDYGLITESATREDYDTLMTWEDWTKGEIDARYVKHRVRMFSDEPDTPLRILRGFTTVIDVPERTERRSGETVAIGGTTFNFDRRFHARPNVTGDVESTDPLFPVRTALDETSVTYVVYDETGTDVGASNFDYTATGI